MRRFDPGPRLQIFHPFEAEGRSVSDPVLRFLEQMTHDFDQPGRSRAAIQGFIHQIANIGCSCVEAGGEKPCLRIAAASQNGQCGKLLIRKAMTQHDQAELPAFKQMGSLLRLRGDHPASGQG